MKVVGPYRCFRDLIYGQAIGGYLLTIDAQNRVPRPSKQCAKFLPRAPIFSRSIPRFHIIPEGRDEIFEQLASKTEDIKKAKKDMTTTCWECARPKSEDVPLKWCSGVSSKFYLPFMLSSKISSASWFSRYDVSVSFPLHGTHRHICFSVNEINGQHRSENLETWIMEIKSFHFDFQTVRSTMGPPPKQDVRGYHNYCYQLRMNTV